MLCKNFDDRTDRLVSRWTKDEQWDKRDQNPGEEKLEFSGHSDECATNKIDQPPPPVLVPVATHHTRHHTMPQLPNTAPGEILPERKQINHHRLTECGAGDRRAGQREMMMMIQIIYIQ